MCKYQVHLITFLITLNDCRALISDWVIFPSKFVFFICVCLEKFCFFVGLVWWSKRNEKFKLNKVSFSLSISCDVRLFWILFPLVLLVAFFLVYLISFLSRRNDKRLKSYMLQKAIWVPSIRHLSIHGYHIN